MELKQAASLIDLLVAFSKKDVFYWQLNILMTCPLFYPGWQPRFWQSLKLFAWMIKALQRLDSLKILQLEFASFSIENLLQVSMKSWQMIWRCDSNTKEIRSSEIPHKESRKDLKSLLSYPVRGKRIFADDSTKHQIILLTFSFHCWAFYPPSISSLSLASIPFSIDREKSPCWGIF